MIKRLSLRQPLIQNKYIQPAAMIRAGHAENSLLFVLVGFAGSVVITRAFLEWAGYPQVASGDFHIAHVLWGGLLLFAAVLLLLIWRGPTVIRLGSLLAGIGFGLFIDEVGKFITVENDYFYPLAAPIIYAFFLSTLFIYVRVRHSRQMGGYLTPHHMVDLLEQGLHPQLSLKTYQHLKDQLQTAVQHSDLETAKLAAYNLAYLDEVVLPRLNNWPPAPERWWDRTRQSIEGWFTQPRLRKVLTAGFVLIALRGLLGAVAAVLALFFYTFPAMVQQASPGPSVTTGQYIFVVAVIIIDGVNAGFFLGATRAMLKGHIERGLTLGYWGLLFSLTIARLFLFYYDQFDVLITVFIQFGILLGILSYRNHFLITNGSQDRLT